MEKEKPTFIKEVNRKEASEKYGIIVKRFHDYKYYLMSNGNVIDSDGDTRFINNLTN